MGSQTKVIRQADGSSMEETVSQSDGQVQTDYVHRDPSGFVTALRHETRQRDADGNQTIDRTTQVFDQQGHMAVDKESHTVVYDHDSSDGRHPAGTSQTTWHEKDVDSTGNVEETEGVSGTDQEHNTSTSESTSDSATGETTLTTTTADANGDGTQHRTVVDANGNPVSDSTTPVSSAAPAPDAGGSDEGDGGDEGGGDGGGNAGDDSGDVGGGDSGGAGAGDGGGSGSEGGGDGGGDGGGGEFPGGGLPPEPLPE
ncbi:MULTISPECIES: hypothetical protein [unclassified Streptomyces]|uniref:hypothetical protein n=1 Tax=unclassified Streptomyces TaxID=2593676 RepID=UPI000A506A77|nr:hypothetical protein [Streptomyces sp. TSRI0281]